MFDLYFAILNKTLEVMILDCNVLRERLHLRIKHEFDQPLIIFVNCDWIFEMIAKYHRCVSLKFDYKLNVRHKTQKSSDIPNCLRPSHIFRLLSTEHYFCFRQDRPYNWTV